jgi:hypothetical protein
MQALKCFHHPPVNAKRISKRLQRRFPIAMKHPTARPGFVPGLFDAGVRLPSDCDDGTDETCEVPPEVPILEPCEDPPLSPPPLDLSA